MTKKQREENARAAEIDEERNRVVARDNRRREFWDGLKARDIAIRDNVMTPQARIASILSDEADGFDAGRVLPMSSCWNRIDYIASFDMTYSYLGSVCTGEDGKTGELLFSVCAHTDSLDEVSLTELVRKSLRQYLTAAAALARRVGSPAYEDYIRLLTEITFEQRCSFYVFSRNYPFKAFFEQLERLHHRLWADNEAYCHLASLKSEKTASRR